MVSGKLVKMEVKQTPENPFWLNNELGLFLNKILDGRENITGEDWEAIKRHFNCELEKRYLSFESQGDISDRWYDGDITAVLDWEVILPSEDWFIVSIHETDDDVVMWLAKNKE